MQHHRLEMTVLEMGRQAQAETITTEAADEPMDDLDKELAAMDEDDDGGAAEPAAVSIASACSCLCLQHAASGPLRASPNPGPPPEIVRVCYCCRRRERLAGTRSTPSCHGGC